MTGSGISLRVYGEKMEDLQAAADCDSLKTYLEKFDLPLLGMQTAEGLREAAKSFLLDLKKENVMYVEVRFAPQLSVHEGFGCSQVIEAVLEGLREAEAICKISWRVICCAMRHHTMEQNLEVFRTATEYLDRGVCAVDLAGDEASYPASQFTDLFAEARALGIPFTIHAGECHSTENVRTSIEMGAKRIGHGIAMKEDPELMKELPESMRKETWGSRCALAAIFRRKRCRREKNIHWRSFGNRGFW